MSKLDEVSTNFKIKFFFPNTLEKKAKRKCILNDAKEIKKILLSIMEGGPGR